MSFWNRLRGRGAAPRPRQSLNEPNPIWNTLEEHGIPADFEPRTRPDKARTYADEIDEDWVDPWTAEDEDED